MQKFNPQMKIHFYLHFHTKPGEKLYVTGDIQALGNCDPDKAFLLQYMNDEFWQGSIELNADKHVKIQYNYIFILQNIY